MKRWTLKLALCLLTGAVVTWGVAWGAEVHVFKMVREPQKRSELQISTSQGEWVAFRDTLSPAAEFWSFANPRLVSGTSLQVPAVDERVAAPMRSAWWMRLQADVPHANAELYGWPLHSLYACSDTRTHYEDPRAIASDLGYLPMRILPLGFTLNTLLAAGVLMGLVETFAVARRRARRSKGRCPACGYDCGGIANGAACPECGGKA